MHFIGTSVIYSMRKVFLERKVVELVYKFDMFEKVSRSLKYDSRIFLVYKHIRERVPGTFRKLIQKSTGMVPSFLRFVFIFLFFS